MFPGEAGASKFGELYTTDTASPSYPKVACLDLPGERVVHGACIERKDSWVAIDYSVCRIQFSLS